MEPNFKAVGKPEAIVKKLLASSDDDLCVIKESESFFDDEAQERFDDDLVEIDTTFDDVLAKLIKTQGKPVFSGRDKDKKFPKWGQTGYRVAFWKVGKRILYLHLSHVDKEMPLELLIGVVGDPPPKDWFVGC